LITVDDRRARTIGFLFIAGDTMPGFIFDTGVGIVNISFYNLFRIFFQFSISISLLAFSFTSFVGIHLFSLHARTELIQIKLTINLSRSTYGVVKKDSVCGLEGVNLNDNFGKVSENDGCSFTASQAAGN